MARWLVTRGDTQFPVNGLGELNELARAGRVGAADMVQPPGTTEWMYISEIPELAEVLPQSGAGDLDDDLGGYGGSSSAMQAVLAVVLIAVIAVGGYFAWDSAQRLPDENMSIIGGKGGLSFSELIVTSEGVVLRSEASPTAPAVRDIEKDSIYELLAKRGQYYKARSKEGDVEGWIEIDKVIPMYRLGGVEVRQEYDPLYNPDRYLMVVSSSWMLLPNRAEEVTIFRFMLRNNSRYPMTDIVMVATIKDAKGHELEQVEFRIEGVVPAEGTSMVGTLIDPEDEDKKRLITETTFQEMVSEDPDVMMSYNDGAEVEMTTTDFTEASIDVVELRAIPRGE